MKKLILSLFLIFSFAILFPKTALAQTWVVGNFQMEGDNPLFSNTTYWFPGMSQTKSLVVRNLGSDTKRVIIKSLNNSQTGNLHRKIAIKITNSGSGLYGVSERKTLENFWNDGEFFLSELSGNSWTTYDFNIEFSANMGNEYQGKEAKFDMQVGFEGSSSQATITAVAGASTTGGVTTTVLYQDIKGEATESASLSGSVSPDVVLGIENVNHCPSCEWLFPFLSQMMIVLVVLALLLTGLIRIPVARFILVLGWSLSVGIFLFQNKECGGLVWERSSCGSYWLSGALLFIVSQILVSLVGWWKNRLHH